MAYIVIFDDNIRKWRYQEIDPTIYSCARKARLCCAELNREIENTLKRADKIISEYEQSLKE